MDYTEIVPLILAAYGALSAFARVRPTKRGDLIVSKLGKILNALLLSSKEIK